MALLIAALILYVAALAATSIYALRRGGSAERQATVALLTAIVATQVANAVGPHWSAPEYGIMAVDAALFVAFVIIAYRSERFWPIWIAAAQLVGLITHLAVVVHPSVASEIYRLTQPFWVFPILIGIVWGTWSHRSRSLSSA